MRVADGSGGNTMQGLFSSYVDVKDRWNKKLLGGLYFVIPF